MTLAFDVAVRAEAELGEGPTWDPATGRLLWIDILSSRLHTYDPATGRAPCAGPSSTWARSSPARAAAWC